MVARMTTCEHTHLKLAVAGKLAEPHATQLSQHLQACAHCRAELEQLAGSNQWWNDAKQYLSSSDDIAALEQGSISTAAHAQLPSLTLPNTRYVHDHDDDEAEELPLGFLSPSSDPNSLGKLGEYEVDEIIGRGGMGMVFKARDPALNRHVAIKVLARNLASSAAARRRFTREAQAAAAVVHDNVIPIHSVGTADQTTFLVMPLVTGSSLQDRLDACGVLTTQEVLRIAMQTARGLAAAHAQGLVHRDVKPANILLDNGVDRVRITDFGLARAVDDASQTQSGFIAGTPQYMAPEQARGEPIDARADLFSLGSVMYAMCTGHPPFRAETTLAVLRRICDDTPRDIRETNAEIPAWLARIIHKLLAKSPDDRFSSADEVATLLESWIAHLQQPTIISPPEPVQPPQRLWRSPKAIAAAAVATVVALATIAYVAWPDGTSSQQSTAPNSEADSPAITYSPSTTSQPSVPTPAATPSASLPVLESLHTTQQVVEPASDEQLLGTALDQELSAIDAELQQLETRPAQSTAPHTDATVREVSDIDAQLDRLEQSITPKQSSSPAIR